MTGASGARLPSDGKPLLRRRRTSKRHPAPAPPPRKGEMYRPGQPIGYLNAIGTPYQKKFLTKKLGFALIFIMPPTAIVGLVIALVPVLWAIADHTLNVVQMNIAQANLTSLTNTSFPLSLYGQSVKAGIFPASLYFREPMDVYWMTPPPNMTEIKLGSFPLGRVNVASGHGKVIQATTFKIADEAAFGLFTEYLVTQPRFTWNLECRNTHVEALGFLPTYKNYHFKKHVHFKGFNNFEQVQLVDFQLPGNDPQGGITYQGLTTLVNPSPFSVQVGYLNVGLWYKDLYMGPGSSAGPINITSGHNTIMLVGRLISQKDNQTALNLASEVFTQYLNGDVVPVVARGESTTLANGDTISWLSQGIKALAINVPLQTPPINPIKSIEIDEFSIVFSEDDPWRPLAFSNNLKALIGLPFGFQLNIVSTEDTIALMYNNSVVGVVEGTYSNSTLSLDVVNQGSTRGDLALTLPPSPLLIGGNQSQQNLWTQYEDVLVFGVNTSTRLRGKANALTDTPIGRILLAPIVFDVESGLTGLQGLNKYPTTISGVDLTGGTSGALLLAIQTTIINPSNLNLSIGTVNFQLVNDEVIGNVTMPNLHLDLGQNNVSADAVFDPRAGPEGQLTLNRFVSGQDTKLYINGYNGSSHIASLQPTLEKIRINTILPGLKKTLVAQASLEVLNTTGIENDTAHALVSIANPFSSGLTISHIAAQVYAYGIRLADIDDALNFPAKGNATSVSPMIPLTLNLYPPDIFGAVRAYAINAGLDPSFIDGICDVGGYNITPTVDTPPSALPSHTNDTLPDPAKRSVWGDEEVGEPGLAKRGVRVQTGVHRLQKRNMFHNFNLTNYVAESFAHATSNMSILANTTVGDYHTPISMAQLNVPLATDNTLFYLLPVLAQPIVQKIVDGALLALDTVTVLDPQEDTFGVRLQGTLTQAGPFDGLVHFPQGMRVNYQGRLLGHIPFPDITLVGDVGATINVTTTFSVANVSFMEEFTKDALNNPSFTWDIASDGIVVDALAISVPNISLSKTVDLAGFNGLKKQVEISAFDLPGNDPAGGIHLDVTTRINNPSQLGMELSTFGVNVIGNETYLGPAAASSTFTLAALAQTPLNLTGRLVEQNSSEGRAVLSNVFTNFVHDQPTALLVNGNNAGPANVSWLNNAIKTLSIPVTLPASRFSVIRGVTLNQLTLAFTPSTAWAPPASSVNTTAPFYLPFSFPINITQVQGQFIANYGKDAAVLNIPASPALTDVDTRVLSLEFANVPFQAYDSAHSAFSQFLTDATMHPHVDFGLHGSATTLAQTAAGEVTISSVPFSVNTSLLGLQGFNARPANVTDLDVFHGYPSYLQINLNTHLYNPSDITIGTGDVQFQVLYNDHPIGPAAISNLVAVPTENVVPTALHYSPQGEANTAAGQQVLNNYVGNVTTVAIVGGYDNSTQVPSLSEALQNIRLTTQIPPLGKLLITQGNLTVPRAIDTDNTTHVKVTVANPFTAALNIKTILSSPVYNNLTLGTINTELSPPIHAPGKEATVSQDVPLLLDTNPKSLVELLLQLAQASGTSLGPWPSWLQRILDMPSVATQVRAVPGGDEASCPANGAFDLQGAMLQALKALAVKIPIVTDTNIDDYGVTLNFTQDPVPIATDDTALYLLGPAGAPLIQQIVDQAGLSFAQGNITNITDAGFTVDLRGTLQTAAPTNALIVFPSPLEIRWQGDFIATISLPPICTIPGQGVPDLMTSGQVVITDQAGFTKFASYILHNERFSWEISSPNVTVLALGITFSQVNLVKNVTFQAFNGLSGVTTNNFNIPGEGSDYLDISVGATIPSPATLGIELGTAKFSLFFQGSELGSAQAEGLTLAPSAATPTTLTGQLVRQTSQTGLENLGVLFSQFLQGHNLSLGVQGVEVDTPAQHGRVGWLSDAFATLQINATLVGKIYEVLFAITLLDLELTVTGDPADVTWSIPTSSKETVAQYANPFHFTLAPTQASVSASVVYQNATAAQLNLPMSGVGGDVSTGPEHQSPLVLSFQNQRLEAANHDTYQQFFVTALNAPEVSFQLTGTADVRANTHIGLLQIDGIGFTVPSQIKGVDSFTRAATLADVQVGGSTPEHIIAPLTATLTNPSNLTLITRDLYLPIFYNGVDMGRGWVKSAVLSPGPNPLPVLFYYAPADPAGPEGLDLLGKYLTPANNGTGGGDQPSSTPVIIGGTPHENQFPESPYESVLPALYAVQADAMLPGLGARLVVEFDLTIDVLPALVNSLGHADLILHNELAAGLTVERIDCNVWLAGAEEGGNPDLIRATVNQDVTPTVSAGAGTIGHIPLTFKMTRGLIFSLDLLTRPLSVSAKIRAMIEGGYVIPALPYTEYDIHTTYLAEVLGIPINITSIADFLPNILSVLNPEQITNNLLPALQQLPTDELQAIAQSLNTADPIVQFACNIIPILKGLPVCQPAVGLHMRDIRRGIEAGRTFNVSNMEPPLVAPPDPSELR